MPGFTSSHQLGQRTTFFSTLGIYEKIPEVTTMQKIYFLFLLGLLLGFTLNRSTAACVTPEWLTTTVTASQKDKLGKLLIKTGTAAEGEFADPKLEDTVKDLKKNHRDFVIVDDEAQADFLIIVLERKNELRSPAGTVVNNKTIRATLSIKEDGKWKPAIKLEHGGGNFWDLAASRVMEDAEKWIKKNIKQP
jgi:hypothetical protein